MDSTRLQITEDPKYIRTLNRPSKDLILYALSLDVNSYIFPLRVKKPTKFASQCCVYHNTKDVRRGYNNTFPLLIDLPKYCKDVYPKYRNLPIENADYSSLPIASQYYGDDIDRILHYTGHNLKILDQLDDDLADELEYFLIIEHNDKPTFLTKIFNSLQRFFKVMYNID